MCDRILFSPQDERVAIICWHKVEVFEIGERQILVYSHNFPCRIAAAAFRGVDSMVFFVTGESKLYFVNLVTEKIETVEFVAADYVAFSDDGQLIACICHNDIKVYNVETRELVSVLSDPHLSGSFCTFSPNGMYLGVCYRGGQMRVFAMKDGTRMIDVKPMQNVATSIAVSNTGTTFVTGSSDTTVTIWELADNTLQWRTLRGHKGSVSALTMDAKQQWVVSGGQDSNINISSMSTEEMVYSVSAHTGFISALAFGHIGLKFVSTSEDCLVKVWTMVEVPCETTL